MCGKVLGVPSDLVIEIVRELVGEGCIKLGGVSVEEFLDECEEELSYLQSPLSPPDVVEVVAARLWSVLDGLGTMSDEEIDRAVEEFKKRLKDRL